MKRRLLPALALAAVGFLLAGPACLHAAESAPLSNELPRELVAELVGERLWQDAFDQSTTAEASDLRAFFQGLQNPTAGLDGLIDSVFGTNGGAPAASDAAEGSRFPHLYPVKIVILRHLLARPGKSAAQQAHLQRVSEKWKARYTQVALATLELTGVPEIAEISRAFRAKVQAGEVRLSDLSPVERARLRASLPADHGRRAARLLERSESTGRFHITGLYSESQRLFYLDLARPIPDTLVTFAHEMVHAADPEIARHRATYDKLLERAVQIVSRWVSGETLALDIITHVFYETGAVEISDLTDSIRQARIARLRESLQGAAAEPTDSELATLREWLRSAIGLTVENEYRAYGLSLVVYHTLKDRMQIAEPTVDRQRFLEKLLAGDHVLAANLSVEMNPFPQARGAVFADFLEKARQGNLARQAPASASGPKNATPDPQMRIAQALNQLELLYLEETNRFLKELGNRFSKLLSTQGLRPDMNGGGSRSSLPEWARPGGFDLPSNPYHVLTARITTAWVLRFRRNVDLILSQLKALNEPLQTSRLGILDLHDITRGERKLIGISYQDSPWANDPAELSESLKTDLDSISPDIAKYFEVVRWDPNLITASDRFIPAQKVAQNLIRLRILKAASWLDQTFPPLKTTLLGTRSFLQRIRERIYEADELSAERARELEQELIEVWKTTGLTQDELVRFRMLFQELSQLHQMASDENWPEIAKGFFSRNLFIIQALENMGVSATQTVDEVRATLQAEDAALKKQLEPFESHCQQVSSADNRLRLDGFWPEKGPFSLRQQSFPLTILCYRQQLYVVRQPGDYLKSMTTIIENGAPHSRIFSGSRPIRLTAMPSVTKRESGAPASPGPSLFEVIRKLFSGPRSGT